MMSKYNIHSPNCTLFFPRFICVFAYLIIFQLRLGCKIKYHFKGVIDH